MTRTAALIVGAGIGGLSPAISLREAGWNVRHFERAASVRELGFALLVAPSEVAAQRELHVNCEVAVPVSGPRHQARRVARLDL